MRAEFFKQIEQSRIDYFKKIKSNENPNPFRNRVEEEQKKTEASDAEEVALKPPLPVQRVFDHDWEKVAKAALKTHPLPAQRMHNHDDDDGDGDAIMESIGAIRIKNFLNRCYKRVVKAFNYWFEVEIIPSSTPQTCGYRKP